MYSTLKIIQKVLHTVLGLIILYIIIALISSCIIFEGETKNVNADKVFYITSNGVHTSFIFPYEDFQAFIPLSNFKRITEQQHIMLGWGDQDFYMNVPEWKDLTLKTAFKSILLPTPSAMHVTLLRKPMLDDYTKEIQVSDKAYKKLIEKIKNTFVLEQNQPIIFLNKGYTENDNFYKAHGSYHAFNTCNSWTNHMMKEADLTHCLWTPFPIIINLYD